MVGSSANHWVTLALLGFALLNVLGNLLIFRGLQPAEPSDDAPLVSILVPARNEARNIEPCIASLLLQDYARWELIVLDDGSDDGTGKMVQQLFDHAANGLSLRLVEGKPLPDGWIGKCWACHQLSLLARGEYLLFADADTIHSAGAVAAILDFARKHRADLVSPWPRFETRTFGEKMIIPMIVLVGFSLCPHWLVALLQRYPPAARCLGGRFTGALGTGNGQMSLFRREAYDRIGGHESVRSEIAEDVALARSVAAHMAEGLRLYNCEAMRFSSVRMYRSFTESWMGFSKNLNPLFARRQIIFWLFVLFLWGCYLAPCIAWLWAPPQRRTFLAVSLVLALMIRLLVTIRFRLSFLSAVLHPIGVGLFIGIALHSWWLSHTGGVVWKDRVYPVRHS